MSVSCFISYNNLFFTDTCPVSRLLSRMRIAGDSYLDLVKMRAVPTWLDKVQDRDKVDQWYDFLNTINAKTKIYLSIIYRQNSSLYYNIQVYYIVYTKVAPTL